MDDDIEVQLAQLEAQREALLAAKRARASTSGPQASSSSSSILVGASPSPAKKSEWVQYVHASITASLAHAAPLCHAQNAGSSSMARMDAQSEPGGSSLRVRRNPPRERPNSNSNDISISSSDSLQTDYHLSMISVRLCPAHPVTRDCR